MWSLRFAWGLASEREAVSLIERMCALLEETRYRALVDLTTFEVRPATLAALAASVSELLLYETFSY